MKYNTEKTIIISNDLNKRLQSYLKRNNLDHFAFFTALMFVFSYKINGTKSNSIRMEKSVGIIKKGIYLNHVLNIDINSKQSFPEFVLKIKRNLKALNSKNIIIHKDNDQNIISYYLALPFFADNQIESKQEKIIQKKCDKFNYKIAITVKKDVVKNIIIESIHKPTLDLARYAKALDNLLMNFFRSENILIKNLELISLFEKKRLIDNFNDLDDRKPKYANIFSYFEELALNNKNKIILEDNNKKITYGEALQRTLQIYNLIKKETEKKQLIIINFLPKEPDLVFSYLGVIKSDNISMMINPDYPRERIKLIFKKVRPNIIITKLKYKRKIESLLAQIKNSCRVKIIFINQTNPTLTNINVENYTNKNKYKNLISNIILTSGSTGNQKAIILKHKALSSFLNFSAPELTDTNKKFRLMSFYSIEFTGFLREILLTIFQGNVLCFLPDENIRLDTESLIKWIGKNKIDYLCVNAETFKNIVVSAKSRKRLKKLKYFFIGPGTITNNNNLRLFVRNHPQTGVYEGFGMSEMGLVRPSFRINQDILSKARIPEFNIYASKQIKMVVLDQDGNIQPAGFIGEMYFHSRHITSGYYNDKKRTQDFYKTNPFVRDKKDVILKTGDFARILENGDVECFGRRDDQININGVKIFASEIQFYLMQYAGISDCIVSTRKTEKDGVFAIAFYLGKKTRAEKLINYLGKWLPKYMIPRYFIFLEKFPLLPNKRIDINKLSKIPFEYQSSSIKLKKLTETEYNVQLIWQEVLNIKKTIDINEDFLNIGGDSLRAMQLYSKINNIYPNILNISDIFFCRTIKKIAKKIDSGRDLEKEKLN